MIELGLVRITRLLKDTPLRWRAIHVAGTNGKGSVCAYTSAMLSAGKIKCGRFTSPHLVDRWDCITIDEKTVDRTLFHEVEAAVKANDLTENIKASEFELLTATAFEIFNREKVEVGIIEVGLGGRYDATNVLSRPSITVITKIGMDHQSYLGNTLEEIAYQKAGIMKEGVQCLVDGSNDQTVLQALAHNARDVGAPCLTVVTDDYTEDDRLWRLVPKSSLEHHQQTNICLAFEAVRRYGAQHYPSLEPWDLLPAVGKTVWPGRLQMIDIGPLVGGVQHALLDGAHNVQSATVLGSFVDRRLRNPKGPVTWIVAVSEGKDIQSLLSCFMRPRDNLVAVEFGLVDGMPWISSHRASTTLSAGKSLGILHCAVEAPGSRLKDALCLAAQLSNGAPLAIAGSLYLVSDVLRLLRKANHNHS